MKPLVNIGLDASRIIHKALGGMQSKARMIWPFSNHLATIRGSSRFSKIGQ